MQDSFKKLLGKFPYFLDKQEGSNFNKSEKVFNNQFKELYQNLFNAYLAGKLRKKVWVWKEQDAPFEYTIHFYSSLPNLKMVTVLENDEVIYNEQYENDENEHIFEYSHSSTSETTIPTDKYNIIVETYDEYEVNKGFPENDTIIGDEYDHDTSLDHIGSLINVKRKQYIDTENVMDTEPPYNDRLSEDDYHYMSRMLFYLQHLQDTPLPVLEIWKLFGISLDEIDLVNREAILCKMFDENFHPSTFWVPEHGEHKDVMCAVSSFDDCFFTVTVDNLSPLEGQNLTFRFKLLNSLGLELTVDSLFIVPYINGEAGNIVTDDVWNTLAVDGEYYFKCYNSREQAEYDVNGLESNIINIHIRDCSDADWYVSINGNDNNTGTSLDAAFRTISKAVSMVEGSKNLIVLSEGEYTVNEPITINHDTKIIACSNDNPVIISENEEVFLVEQDSQLLLKNIGLNYSLYSTFIDEANWVNHNLNVNGLYVIVDVLEILANSNTPLNLLFGDNTIDTALEDNRDWNVEITDQPSNATFIVDDDSDNPNLIIKEEEEEAG